MIGWQESGAGISKNKLIFWGQVGKLAVSQFYTLWYGENHVHPSYLKLVILRLRCHGGWRNTLWSDWPWSPRVGKGNLPRWVVHALFSSPLCPGAGPVQNPGFSTSCFPLLLVLCPVGSSLSSVLSFLIWRRQSSPGIGAGQNPGLWLAGGPRALPLQYIVLWFLALLCPSSPVWVALSPPGKWTSE